MPEQNKPQDSSFDFERQLETLIRDYLKKLMTITEIEICCAEVIAGFRASTPSQLSSNS